MTHQKKVTVSLVQITQYEDTRGMVIEKVENYRLRREDSRSPQEALRDAGFEWVNTLQEAIDAKLAEGRDE